MPPWPLSPWQRLAVVQVERVATLHVGDVLVFRRLLHAPLRAQGRDAGLREPVDGDEEGDDEDGQEDEAARIGALAHDLGAALLGQSHRVGLGPGGEALHGALLAFRGRREGRVLGAGVVRLARRELASASARRSYAAAGRLGRDEARLAERDGQRAEDDRAGVHDELTVLDDVGEAVKACAGPGPSSCTLVPSRS